MSLPVIISPRFTVQLPSDGRKVSFRPFVVKEEKALLLAAEQKQEDMIACIKMCLTACCDDLDISTLPFFDVEFLFLNVRAKSIGEEVKFTYKHRDGINREGKECRAETEVVIDIEEVKVLTPEIHTNKFMIDDVWGVTMKYPTIDSIKDLVSGGQDEMKLMASCIVNTYNQDEVFTPDDVEDSVRFIEDMSAKQYEKFSEFFNTLPTLTHSVTYHCSGCGQEDVVKFEGVSDFF